MWADRLVYKHVLLQAVFSKLLQVVQFSYFIHVILLIYRWVPLKPDFLGAWKSVWLKHYPAYPVIIISLIIQRNLATKIRAKRESGLTAVRLKWDPLYTIWTCMLYSYFTFVSNYCCIHCIKLHFVHIMLLHKYINNEDYHAIDLQLNQHVSSCS